MKKALFSSFGVLVVALFGPPAYAYTPALPLPPKWPRPPERIEIDRDALGRITRMSLPEGDTLLYKHDAATPIRIRFEDLNFDGRRQPRRERLLGLGRSEMIPSAIFTSDRMILTTSVLEKLTSPIRKSENYSRFLTDIVSDFLKSENTTDLSAQARAALERQLDMLESCNAEVANALRIFLRGNRIRHSPLLTDAAIADGHRNGTLYLSTPWVAALEGRSDFTPAVRWLQLRDEETGSLRRRYFGSTAVTFETLGNPSRTWLFLLGLIHELGHFVQYEEQNRFDMARDLYTYDLFQLTAIINAQAPYGFVTPGYLERRDKIQFRMEGWKQAVESGANFFALDALAGCAVKLGGDTVPPWRETVSSL